MPKVRICMAVMHEERSEQARALAGAVSMEFPGISVSLASGVRGIAEDLRMEAHDLVIVDGVVGFADALMVASNVGTSEYRRFNGFSWSGTSRSTPVILVVPRGDRPLLERTANITVVEEPIEMQWLIDYLVTHGFTRHAGGAPTEVTRNRISEQAGVTTVTPVTPAT